MIANKYWESDGISFKNINIKHQITSKHIECVIAEMVDWNEMCKHENKPSEMEPKKITKKVVKKKIEYNLYDRGNVWVDYHYDNNFSDDVYIKAKEIGKKLFPSFYEIYT